MGIQQVKHLGRTSRMLDHAARLAKEGRAVYIVVANSTQVIDLRVRLDQSLGIKIETPETLPLNWSTMKSRHSMHPNCVVLVDHYAIESRYASLLEMYHRYDEETPPTQSQL